MLDGPISSDLPVGGVIVQSSTFGVGASDRNWSLPTFVVRIDVIMPKLNILPEQPTWSVLPGMETLKFPLPLASLFVWIVPEPASATGVPSTVAPKEYCTVTASFGDDFDDEASLGRWRVRAVEGARRRWSGRKSPIVGPIDGPTPQNNAEMQDLAGAAADGERVTGDGLAEVPIGVAGDVDCPRTR